MHKVFGEPHSSLLMLESHLTDNLRCARLLEAHLNTGEDSAPVSRFLTVSGYGDERLSSCSNAFKYISLVLFVTMILFFG